MFLGAARKLCPELVTVPYEFEEYQRISQIMYDTVLKVCCNPALPSDRV